MDGMKKEEAVRCEKTSLYGCILIGGKSSRMGQPKHLIKTNDNITWLDHSVNILSPFVDNVILAGAGDIPPHMESLERITDERNVAGPLAGILSAMNSWPTANWIVLACDMPLISKDAVSWLLGQYDESKCAGVVPQNQATGKMDPLFAYYSSKAITLFDKIRASGRFSITQIVKNPEIFTPSIPAELINNWRNINTQEQLRDIRS